MEPSFLSIGSGNPTPVEEPVVHVEAARIPDRDRLVEALREAGLDARAVEELEIEVPCRGANRGCDEVFPHVEATILSLGAPFVPVEHDGVIYVRPPLS